MPTAESYVVDSEEAELREAELTAERIRAGAQKRARAEVMAVQQAAADAQATCAALPTHDDDEIHGWMSDYEISRLRTTVSNEQDLLSLNIITSAQLSNTLYQLEKAVGLQCVQRALVRDRLGHAVVTVSIAHAIQEYYSRVLEKRVE